MPRLYGRDLAFNVHAEQGEVTDDVEYLVADEFVVETQGSFVEHPVRREDDRIVERTAEREICLAKHLDLVRKAEGAGRSYFFSKRTVLEYKIQRLPLDKRVREVDDAVDLVIRGGFDRHFAVALFVLDLFEDPQDVFGRMLLDDAGVCDQFDKIFARTVHDRDLDVVEFDKTIIDAAATQGGKKVFAGGKHDAAAHQRRRVAAMRDIFDRRRYLEIIKIRPDKYITRILRSRL